MGESQNEHAPPHQKLTTHKPEKEEEKEKGKGKEEEEIRYLVMQRREREREREGSGDLISKNNRFGIFRNDISYYLFIKKKN